MVTDAGTDPTNPSPPPPSSADDDRRVGRLVRRPDRGPLGGVCAGIAEHFGLDVTLVRIGAVILACLGPGVPAYIVAWIFLPAADRTSPPPRLDRAERDDRLTQAIGIGLIVIALSVLWGDWWVFGRGWFLPLGLIGLGAWLLLRSSQDDDVPPVPPVPPAPPVPTGPPNVPAALISRPSTATVDAPVDETRGTEDGPAGEGTTDATDVLEDPAISEDPTLDTTFAGGEPPDGGSGTAVAAVPEPPAPPPIDRTPRRGRFLGPLVFGLLLLWAGVAWLVGVDARDGLAVGLCLVGVGFVVGAFVGGSKALIAPALLLAAALATVTIIDIPFEGGIGDRHWSVTSVRDLEDSYELGIGHATLDLRDLQLSTRRAPEVSVHVGIGRLEVIVPEGVALDVHAEAGAGEVDVLGHRDDGMGVDFDRRLVGDAGAGTIELDLKVGLGRVEVREAPRTAALR